MTDDAPPERLPWMPSPDDDVDGPPKWDQDDADWLAVTGRYPSATGVRNNGAFVVPSEETTLAEALAARGFRTGAVVAAFPLQRRYGLAQGFEVYDDDLPPAPLDPGAAFSVHFAERGARVVTDRALALWSRLPGPRLPRPRSPMWARAAR